MEQLLTWSQRQCPVCQDAALLFRLSRFGCVFSCPKCLYCRDVKAVFAEFVARCKQYDYHEDVDDSDTAFIPVMRTENCSTEDIRVCSLEPVPSRRCVSLRFTGFTDGDRPCEVVAASFSRAISEKLIRCPDGSPSLEIEMQYYDAVMEELRQLRRGGAFFFFVNGLSDAALGLCAAPVHRPAVMALHLSPLLQQTLMRHQLEGVHTLLHRHHGRCILADEMGVGKTLQLIAALDLARPFPVLLVCPSVIKYMWAAAIEQYLCPAVGVDDILLINGSNDNPPQSHTPKVVLVSYHMVSILGESLLSRGWRCLVCDESHLLHTTLSGKDARYTRLLHQLSRRVDLCLLLTGTPALASPFDMYNQLDMVRAGMFGQTRYEFAWRYCRITIDPFMKVDACVRPGELRSLLDEHCFVRRLKRDILDLPAKRRAILRVRDSPGDVADRAAQHFQIAYSSAWRGKLPGVLEAIDYYSAKYAPLVLFAHHIDFMDAIERHVTASRRLRYARIDGTVPPLQRSKVVSQFADGHYQVLIVGITACAVGLSLAAAKCAIFCELPPDISWMCQAEDRLHRLGQQNEVHLLYVLGVHSAFDRKHFATLCETYQNVNQVVAFGEDDVRLSQVLHRTAAVGGCATSEHLENEFPPSGQSENQAKTVSGQDGGYVFRISANTRRVHATHATGDQYVSLSPHGALAVVRGRQHEMWRDLSAFLETFDSLSTFSQRQVIASRRWLPPRFEWSPTDNAIGRRNGAGPRVRYAVTTPRVASAVGWGVWLGVPLPFAPHSLRTAYRFARVRRGPDGGWVALCLQCEAPVCISGLPGATAAPLPGRLIQVEQDHQLFCSGACRETYFLTRSSAAIRRAVESRDGGVCNFCHVNCTALLQELVQCATEDERVVLIQRAHPALAGFPTLVANLLRTLSPGCLWNADHIVPVALGGGMAGLDNLQTLCVACHAMKTAEDVRKIARSAAGRGSNARSQNARTTVNRAIDSMLLLLAKEDACPASRVTRRRSPRA